MGRMRRVLRWLKKATLWTLGSVLGLVLVVYLGLISPWGNELIRAEVERAAQPAFPGGALEIGGLDTNLITGIVLEDVAIVDKSDKTLIGIERFEVGWGLLGLLGGELEVDTVRLDRPVVDLRVLEDGTLDLQKVLGPPEPDEPSEPWTGLPIDVVIPAAVIADGTVSIGGATTPVQINALGLDLGVALQGPGVHVDHLDLEMDMQAPYALPISTEGEVIFTGADVVIPELALHVGDTVLRVDGRLAGVADAPVMGLSLRLDPLAPSTLETVVGEPVLKQPVTFEATLTGPLSELTLDSTLASAGLGTMDLDVVVGLESDPLAWDVKLVPHSFQVDGLLVAAAVPVMLEGTYAVSGVGTQWPAGIKAEIDFDAGAQVLGGEAVAALKLTAALDAGVLKIEGLSARHSAAEVDLSGTADLVNSRAGIDLRARVPRLSALAAYGAAGMGGSAGFDGHIDAAWDPTIRVDVDGAVSLQNISASGTRVQRGEGKVQVAVRGEDISAMGGLQVINVEASGTRIRSIAVQFKGGQTAAGDVHVDAGLDIDSVAMDGGSFEMEGLDGTLRARVPAKGALVAKADLNVQTFHLNKGSYTVQGGPITVEAKGDEVWADINLKRRDAPFLTGRIEGNLATGKWDISGFQLAVKPGDGLIAKQNISVTLGEDGAEAVLIEIDNPGGRGHIRVQGRATAADPDLHLEVDKVDLTYVMEMVHELIGEGAKDSDGSSAAKGGDVEEDDFAPVFPGDKGDETPTPESSKVAARTEQSTEKAEKMLGGLASMDLRVRTVDGAFVATGWVELEGLVVPDQLEGGHLRLGLDVGPDQAKIDLRVRAGEQLVLYTEGHVPLDQKHGVVAIGCDRELDVRTMVPALKLGRLAEQVPALAGIDGRVSMDLRARGKACDPDLALVAATDIPVGSQGERARIDLRFTRVGDKVVLKTTLEEDQKRLVRVDSAIEASLTELIKGLKDGKGTVQIDQPETWLKSFDASVVLEAVPLEEVARLADINHPLQGILGGGLHVSGTLQNPELQAGLVVVNGRIGEVDLQRGTLEIVPADGGYQLDSDLSFEDGGSLGVHGHLPLNLGTMDLTRPGLDIDVTGMGLPLAVAAGPGALENPRGMLAIEGKITGTLAAPKPAVGLKTQDAGFTLAAVGLRYDPVDIDIGFTPERLDIRRFEMQTKPFWSNKPRQGVLSVRGTVDLEDGELTNVALVADMKEFWLANIKLATLAVTGKLEIGGAYPDLTIGGALAADEARFEVGEADLAESSGLEMDSTIVVHRQNAEVKKVVPTEAGPSDSDNFDVSLKLDLQQRLNLKADIPLSSDFGKQFSQLATFSMEMTLGGALNIVQRRGELELAGEVVPLRGFLEVLGKRFDLQEGRLVFTGANYTSPVLDLTASHQVGQYGAVEIKITGDASAPEIAFSSPEYPDQTDVMSMLLFGKPASAMSETEGESGSGLLSAALSTVGGQAARSSGAAFLQNVSVDPGSGSVKVGFPLSDKVYLAIERLQPESETDNMTQASVEWILSRSTYAEIITGDQGKSSGDLYWRWRF